MSSERRKLVLGAGWTLSSTLVALTAGAILNLILVLYLGISGYGIWASAIAIASLFGVAGDLGVGGALTKFVAERRGQREELGSLAGNALALGLLAGCVGGAALAGVSLFIGAYVSYPGFPFLLQLQAVQLPFNLGTSTLLGLLQGHRQFRTFALSTIAQSIGNLGLTMILLALGLGVPGAMVASLLMSASLFLALVVLRKSELVLTGLSDFRLTFQRLVPFGLNLTATNALSTVLYEVDIVAVSLLIRSPAIVGAYALAVFVTRGLWVLPSSISLTTYPVVSEYAAARDGRRLARYLSTALVASIALTGAVAVGLVVFGQPLLNIIFGPESVPTYGYVLIMLFGTATLGCLRSVAPSLAGVGRPDVGLRISALGAVTLILLSFGLTHVWGATGTAMAVSITFAFVAFALIWAINRHAIQPESGLIRSSRVVRTAGLAVAAGIVSALIAVPLEFDWTRWIAGGLFWAVSIFALIAASGGRETWGSFVRRSAIRADQG